MAKKDNKTEETIKPITGFDSKNRIVSITETDGIYTVTKESTGFLQECLSLDEAQLIFDNQISCSQN